MMSAKEVALMIDVPDEVRRWTAKRRAAVVMSIVKGETSAAKDEQIAKLQRKVGELVLDIDILKEANKGRPFGPGTCDE